MARIHRFEKKKDQVDVKFPRVCLCRAKSVFPCYPEHFHCLYPFPFQFLKVPASQIAVLESNWVTSCLLSLNFI